MRNDNVIICNDCIEPRKLLSSIKKSTAEHLKSSNS